MIEMSEVNRISDITSEEIKNFNGDLENRGIWIQNIAIPCFTVNVRYPQSTAPYFFREISPLFRELIKPKTERFDSEKPIILGSIKTNAFEAVMLFGTPKEVYASEKNMVLSNMVRCTAKKEYWEAIGNGIIFTFSYINAIFLTQPPTKSKTRIEKTYETLLNGQVISHPQKVTFYQLPAPEQINHRKIAAYKKEWHCPAWGVRGHYRHYKSGKVVFIKSYVKGKDKSKYEGREYDIGLVAKGGAR